MVVTDDEKTALKARGYRNLCYSKKRRFEHEELGFNFRMTNLQAAVGVAQLEQIDRFIEIKRSNAMRYSKRLGSINGLKTPVEEKWAKNVYWMYAIELSEELDIGVESMIQKLSEKGVGTRPFFLGLHEQPVFQKIDLFTGEHYPIAERIARTGLYLPSGLTLTDDQIDQVCDAVEEIIEEG